MEISLIPFFELFGFGNSNYLMLLVKSFDFKIILKL